MPGSTRLATERRARGFVRKLRAMWHDTTALWREFRMPLTLFLLATVGGGLLYGELWYLARQERYAFDVLPLMMLQLMILESPSDIPPEWYLVVFWYAQPVVGFFIVARGASDFMRLFFNRDERRDAWGEAVAATYRNHVIVFGAGHVGLRVIRELVQLGFDVIAIDNEPDDGVDDELKRLDVPLITADGRVSNTLQKAQITHADAFIACTGNDHINLEVVMKARDLNPDVRIVLRAWDTGFANQVERFMNVQSVLSSSDLAAPAFAGAAAGVEITQTLQVSGVEYSMVRLTVTPGSFMDGRSVGQLQAENQMDIVLHGHGQHAEVQPARDALVSANDTLVIFAAHPNILSVIARNRRARY